MPIGIGGSAKMKKYFDEWCSYEWVGEHVCVWMSVMNISEWMCDRYEWRLLYGRVWYWKKQSLFPLQHKWTLHLSQKICDFAEHDSILHRKRDFVCLGKWSIRSNRVSWSVRFSRPTFSTFFERISSNVIRVVRFAVVWWYTSCSASLMRNANKSMTCRRGTPEFSQSILYSIHEFTIEKSIKCVIIRNVHFFDRIVIR